MQEKFLGRGYTEPTSRDASGPAGKSVLSPHHRDGWMLPGGREDGGVPWRLGLALSSQPSRGVKGSYRYGIMLDILPIEGSPIFRMFEPKNRTTGGENSTHASRIFGRFLGSLSYCLL